ncbi:type II toxin-antitoxin system ParD family antitoxin [Rhizobium pusense]|uniref:type II toxin-antitoxin system ParD family antitoxin n=1 Tax=Agrobacterium pusense TaxID=648995 RepID=UPI00244B8A75|nr:type II toxin-antitoxin system ParD family antitoxin [Agrobacterium pusense]MDH1270780.1 type II toxin-antitoxin system ParD family antitoxin [Agrobacterium pusense]
MATVNVSLSNPMKEWVETQAKTGRYLNASDCVRDVIRRDQVRAEKVAAMQRHVDEGMASGTGNRTITELFKVAAARAEVSD